MPTESPTPAQILITPGSGVTLDAVSVTVNAASVDREVIVIGDPATGTQYAEVNPKGTQADNFLGVQNAKDSGRAILQLTAYAQTATSTTSVTVITSLIQNSNYTSSTGVTAFQVPAGKTLRIQSMYASAGVETLYTTTNTNRQCLYVTIRVSTTNTTTALSTAPIAAEMSLPLDIGTSVGDIGGRQNDHAFPDGVEVPATYYVGISFHNATTTGTTQLLEASLIGYTY